MRRTISVVVSAVLAVSASVVTLGAAQAAAHGTLLATLQDPAGAPFNDFGSAVASDGKTAVVSSPGTNFAHGAVYVFTKGKHGWPTTPTATLLDPGGSNSDIFGNAVAIDDTTIVVGAYGSNSGAGAAYIYVKGDHGWRTTPTVTLHDPVVPPGFDLFGSSVAVHRSTVVVGAYGAFPSPGAAYIYVKGRHGWPTAPTTSLADPPATAGDLFGNSVAVSTTTAVIGAANGDAVYIYVKGKHGWPTTPTVSLADPGGASYDAFGNSVAIDGQTVVVGANGNGIGAAYIYVMGSTGWPTAPTITLADPTGLSNDDYGSSVAVAGSTVAVGAANTNSGNGAAYTYIKGTGPWPTSPTTTLADPAAAGLDQFGASVALDTTTVLVGGWATYGYIGQAYIFTS